MQTLSRTHALASFDLSDPAQIREVSRLNFDDKQKPHWIAADEHGRRLVMNSGEYGDLELGVMRRTTLPGHCDRRDRAAVLRRFRVRIKHGQKIASRLCIVTNPDEEVRAFLRECTGRAEQQKSDAADLTHWTFLWEVDVGRPAPYNRTGRWS
ncbi:MAG: hypothetical protein LC804_25020 [Acidobacteria bacterium]|nr:hypothetical protein [Acidobacteriota bacterium]